MILHLAACPISGGQYSGNNYSVSLRLALLGLSLKKVGEFSVGDAGN